MSLSQSHASFAHVQDEELRLIIKTALQAMNSLLESTPCLSSLSLVDQLNEIKKEAFEKLYAIGRETLDREKSEEVLKAIRALQDAFAQIVVAISPMEGVRYCMQDVWLKELG